MANIDTQSLTNSIIGAVSSFIIQHDAPHQAVQAASEAVGALSSALNTIRLPSFPGQPHSTEIVEQLEHGLDWTERKAQGFDMRFS